MRRILVAGASGQLGQELARLHWPQDVDLVAPPESEFDVTDPVSVARVVGDTEPDVLINAAAYTAVDRAEDEADLARKVNVDAVGHLVRDADAASAVLIHVSTDYVFDGEAEGWYVEDDRPNPTGVYGATKLAGEQLALDADCGLVLRTSWVYGALGDNFVRTMRRLALERPRIGVVDDQRGCPTAALELARAIRAILEADSRPSGLFHAAAPDDATWWELAVAAIEQLTPPPEVVIDKLTTAGYPTRARRPMNSRLSSEKLHASFGVRLAPWREALAEVSRELNAPTTAESQA